jgi:hypothetical protein
MVKLITKAYSRNGGLTFLINIIEVALTQPLWLFLPLKLGRFVIPVGVESLAVESSRTA